MLENLSALLVNLALQRHNHLYQVLGGKDLKRIQKTEITSLVFPLNLERTSCGRRLRFRSGEGLVSRPSTTRAPKKMDFHIYLLVWVWLWFHFVEKHQLTIGRSHACVRIGSGIVRLDRVASQIWDRGIWSLSHKTWQKKKLNICKKGFSFLSKNVPFPFPYLDRSSKLPRKHARVGYMLWTRTKYKTEAGSIGSCSILIKKTFLN